MGEGGKIEIPLGAASIYRNTISRTNLNHAMPRVCLNVVRGTVGAVIEPAVERFCNSSRMRKIRLPLTTFSQHRGKSFVAN